MNSDSENDPIIKLLNLLNFVRVLDNRFTSIITSNYLSEGSRSKSKGK